VAVLENREKMPAASLLPAIRRREKGVTH
jgi:hypothetical protein